jgi:hypothetical protein
VGRSFVWARRDLADARVVAFVEHLFLGRGTMLGRAIGLLLHLLGLLRRLRGGNAVSNVVAHEKGRLLVHIYAPRERSGSGTTAAPEPS